MPNGIVPRAGRQSGRLTGFFIKKKGRLAAALQCHSNLDQLRGRECYRTIFAAPPHCLEAASTGEDGPEQPNRARKRRRILTAAARGRFGIAGNVAGATDRTDHVGREIVAVGAVLGEVGDRDAAEVDHLEVQRPWICVAGSWPTAWTIDRVGEVAIGSVTPCAVRCENATGRAGNGDNESASDVQIEREGVMRPTSADKIGVRRERNDDIDFVRAVLGQGDRTQSAGAD